MRTSSLVRQMLVERHQDVRWETGTRTRTRLAASEVKGCRRRSGSLAVGLEVILPALLCLELIHLIVGLTDDVILVQV